MVNNIKNIRRTQDMSSQNILYLELLHLKYKKKQKLIDCDLQILIKNSQRQSKAIKVI